jgi:hypothetical protein
MVRGREQGLQLIGGDRKMGELFLQLLNILLSRMYIRRGELLLTFGHELWFASRSDAY